ncbi:hypothetical protein BGX28_000543 [Mortierella sp. GBA30]|nr:hypothetical protein BGX28_000543 [Mortierella sp. GBA30]
MASPRTSVIQFSSTDNIRELPVHQEEEGDAIPKLKDIPLMLTRTKTGESTGSRTLSRRSSLAAFADRLRSHSRTRSSSGQPETTEGIDPSSRRSSVDEDYQFKYIKRRSSDFTGAYADVARAQALFMEKLREEQERKNIKFNADGLPIPPPRQHSRRSSVTQILGMDKPLLAR